MLIKWSRILLLFISILLVTSCSTSNNLETQQPIDKEAGKTWSVPEAKEDTGVIYGKLINADSKSPIKGTPFLSRNLSYLNNDLPATISFSFQYDPRAIVNEQTGEIYFQDIEPAENYVIMLYYGPGISYVVRDTEGDNPLMIEIKSGESVDIGTIKVSEP